MSKERKGRRVKCYATGEYGTDLTFVKIDGHYYKDEFTYERYIKNKEYRTLVYDKLADFLGYQKGQIFPGIVHKKLKDLEFYGFECIYKTICKKENDILWALNHKDFRNDMGRIAYMFAIIDNNINDVYKSMRTAKKRLIMPSEAADYIEVANLESIGTSKKGRDISAFLGE